MKKREYTIEYKQTHWPLEDDRWPRKRADHKKLDRRFVQSLGQLIDDSFDFIEHELSDARVGPRIKRRLLRQIAVGVLAEWARLVVNRDSVINVIVYGAKRDRGLLSRLFAAKFKRRLRPDMRSTY